jgi:outer membrane protein assembly factor BamE (lipoprotein component of BamABCDE complex)
MELEMNTRTLIIVALAALALVGCNVNPNVATANEVYTAGNAWYAAQVAGNTYMRLPLCSVAPAPCRTQAMTVTVYADLKKGNTLAQTVLADVNAGTPVSLTLMQSLTAIVTTLQSLPTANTGR